MPHGRHIYAKATYTENSKMCAYPHSDNALTHWKRVLRCCANCPRINLTDQLKKTRGKKTLNYVSNLSRHWTLYYSWQSSIERQESMLHYTTLFRSNKKA